MPPSTLPDTNDLMPTSLVSGTGSHRVVVKPAVRKPKYRKIWWLALIALLVLLAAGGYALMASHKVAPPKANKTTSSQVVPSDQSTVTATTHYVSKGNDLNLSFDYPSSWTVSPTSGGNSSDQTITVTSPLTIIVGADSKSITGKAVVSIRPASAGLTELSSGNATTAQASVQFAYSKPTANQHQYPYQIFIHLAGGTNPNAAFEEVLISGVTQFAKGQSITDTSIAVDPIIAANIYSCNTSACTGSGAVPLGITNNTWQNNNVFQQTQSLFASLQIN